MYDWLAEIADEVVLAHPTKVRAIAEARIKTDTYGGGAVKRVLRQRMFFVRVRTMFKNRIRALLSQHAVPLPEVSDLYGKAGLRWLKGLSLPDPDGRLLREDIALLEELGQRIAASEDLIAELAADDAAVRWLASLPGIGEFLSVLVRYEVDAIGRFREAKQFASYTGLVPSTYASGARLVHGRLTKQGNKWLRWAFIEAVTPAICRSSSLRRYYERIKARRGAKDARAATARKLAELVWVVWTQQRCYAVL
jgi:transposase